MSSCQTDDGLQSEVDTYCDNRDRAEYLLMQLKNLFGFPAEHGLHGSYGVGSKELSKEDNRLYEVYKVLAKAIFEATKKPTDPKEFNWCVDNDDPYLLNFSGDKKIPCEIRFPDRTVLLHKKEKQ